MTCEGRTRSGSRSADIEALAAEVGGAELIVLVVEPGRAYEGEPLDVESLQANHSRGAGRRDRERSADVVIGGSLPAPVVAAHDRRVEKVRLRSRGAKRFHLGGVRILQ